MAEVQTRWYILYVYGGREMQLCDYLNHVENLYAFTIQKEVAHKRQGSMFTVLKPMFPSYIFVETLLDHACFTQLFNRLRSEKGGLIKELKYDDEIPSLLPEERQYLERLVNSDKVVETSKGFVENDKVVITEGPLMGYESSIVKIDRHQRKAELELKVLDNALRVTVSLEIVKKI
ncbi:MAG: antiterminator LoaP [Longicatena sp.]